MSTLRNPLRPAFRTPLRGPLESRFGGSSPIAISAPGAVSFLQPDQPQRPSLSFSDAEFDGGADAYTVTVISTNSVTFTVNAGSGATITTDGTASVTIEGTLAQCNAALAVDAGNEGFDDFSVGAATSTIRVVRDSDAGENSKIISFDAYIETLTGLRFPENNNESAYAGHFGSIQQPIANFPTVLDGADTNSGAGAFFAIVRVPLPRMVRNNRHLLMGSGVAGNNNFGLSVYSRDYNVAGSRGRAEFNIVDASANSVDLLSELIDEQDVLLVAKLSGDDWQLDWYSLADGTKTAGTPTIDTACVGISSHGPSTSFIVGGVGSDISANPKNLTGQTSWWEGDILEVGYVDADIADATWQSIALGADTVATLGSANLPWYRKLTDKTTALAAVASADNTNGMTLLDGGNIKLGSAIKRQDTNNYITIDPVSSGRVFGVAPGASTATVDLSGTAGGYTGNVEARLINDDGVTVQQDWQTVGAIGGGTWSGSITCDKTSGWTFIEARVVGTTRPVARNAEYVGVGYKVGYIGQSEMEYPFLNSSNNFGLSISEANAQRVSVSNWKGSASSGTGVDFPDLTFRLGAYHYSDGFAQMVNQYVAYGDDAPLQIVSHALNGTSARHWMDDSQTGRYWTGNPTPGGYDTADILAATGADYTVLVWNWGTSDNIGTDYSALFDSVVDGAAYTPGGFTVDHYLRDGSFGANFDMVLSPFTRREISVSASEDPDTGLTRWTTRKTQRSYAEAEGWTVGPETGDLRIENDLGPHPSQDFERGVRRFAERLMIAAARGIGLDTSSDPTISGMQFTDGNKDEIAVSFTLPNGGSLTTNADDLDVRGLEISDNFTAGTPTWSKDGFTAAISGNTVLINKTSGFWAGGGDTAIRYMFGSPGSYGTADSETDHLDGILYETYALSEFDGALPIVGTYVGAVGGVEVSELPGAFALLSRSNDMGALSINGTGDIPALQANQSITNPTWSITAGDASGHFDIDAATGVTTPSVAGNTANLNLGPYSLTVQVVCDEGTDSAVQTVATSGVDANGINLANAYSVADIDQLETVLELSSLTYGTNNVLLRGGTYNDAADVTAAQIAPAAYTGTKTAPSDLSPSHQGKDVATGSYITVRPHEGETATIRRLQLLGVTSTQGGIRFTGCAFEWQPATVLGTPQSIAMLRFAVNDVLVDNCDFQSTVTVTEDVPLTCIIIDSALDEICIQDNTASDFDHFIVNSSEATNLTIVGNECRNGWADQVFFNSGGQNVRINWNVFTDKLHKATGAHPDFFQLTGNSALSDVDNFEIIGNQFYRGVGVAGENDGQGIFINNIPTKISYDTQTGDFTVGLTVTGGTSGDTGSIVSQVDNGTTGTINVGSETGFFQVGETITDTGGGSATITAIDDLRVTNCRIRGNFINISLTNCISVEDADDVLIANNTAVVDLDNILPPTTTGLIVLTGNSTQGGNIVDNISNGVAISPGITAHANENNTTLAANLAAYQAEFDNPTFGSNLTDPPTDYAVKIGSASDLATPKRGAMPSVNFAARTVSYDLTGPTVSLLTPLDDATGVAVDATPSVQFTEDVEFVVGSTFVLRDNDGAWADLETFTATTGIAATGDNGGSAAIVDDTLTITPGADMAGGIEHAIRIGSSSIRDYRHNNFAGISDDTTWSFTVLSGYTETFVDNQGSAYFTVSAANMPSDSATVNLAMRIIPKVISGLQYLYNPTASNALYMATGKLTMFWKDSAGTVAATWTTGPTLSVDTEYFIEVVGDLTSTGPDPNGFVDIIVNGTSYAATMSANTGLFNNKELTGFLSTGAGTSNLDVEISELFFSTGSLTSGDLYNSGTKANLADLAGHTPEIYFGDGLTAAEWNSKANRGSISAANIVLGGTFASV